MPYRDKGARERFFVNADAAREHVPRPKSDAEEPDTARHHEQAEGPASMGADVASNGVAECDAGEHDDQNTVDAGGDIGDQTPKSGRVQIR